jgi:hypothetical protein
LRIAVVDAATVVDLTCDFPAAEPYRGTLASATAVAAPAHLDAEVISPLDRLQRAGRLTGAAERVDAFAAFGARRWAARAPLLDGAARPDRDPRRAPRRPRGVARSPLITTDGRRRRAAVGIIAVAEPDE